MANSSKGHTSVLRKAFIKFSGLNEEAGYKRGRNSPIFRDLIACDNG